MRSTVRDIMTSHVVSVTPDATVERMGALFDEGRFHHLLVMEHHKVVGVISDRDLLRHLSPWAGTMGESKSDAATLRKRAHQIMSRGVVCAEPQAPVLEAIQQMLRNRISCLPVIDEQRHCQGILTWRDVLRWTADRLIDEAEQRDAA